MQKWILSRKDLWKRSIRTLTKEKIMLLENPLKKEQSKTKKAIMKGKR
jgi:hypothetical protein